MKTNDCNKNELLTLLFELKKYGIKDKNVLKAIEYIPRDFFIEKSIKSKSLMNVALPIDCGQTISQPLVVAKMTQELELSKNLRILEIGTGSGYQTAILSQLSRFVYTIERFKTLKIKAEKKFKSLNLNNVFTKHNDGGMGWPEQEPFDRILVTASAPEIPKILLKQLSFGGIMVVPVGEENTDQMLIKIIKKTKKIEQKNLMKVRFVPLLEGKVQT
ncbi:MAG: protein-L-isoaspartate O-methyltransferase [Rickettsiales bacterium]|nr:protein-L-isoaspartate O-methyltransferase [Rickettsiales bacterium]OUV52839.1 MAG: protein-L-isoaspartate O-methyltransferase [Rickettsiales bacterium TMED127]|tara:strand:- start:21451 stop:22101 length:651 start_codon:yes stop_codon:yes gene_type:complete